MTHNDIANDRLSIETAVEEKWELVRPGFEHKTRTNCPNFIDNLYRHIGMLDIDAVKHLYAWFNMINFPNQVTLTFL